MIIHKLEMYLSKRLALNSIKKITYTPEHLHQLILGTNGSGKSSVMAELSPLPANAGDYEKDGYKYIEISHRNKYYKLLSDFTGGKRRYSFICNDTELNDGGTLSVYTQLVKEHFGLDSELYELLIGVSNFREMNPTQRRNWLVRMANDNMSYAISLYNKTKAKHNEAKSVVKYLAGRIVEETNKVPDYENRVLELGERLSSLKQQSQMLYELKMGEYNDFMEKEYTFDDLARLIQSTNNKVKNVILPFEVDSMLKRLGDDITIEVSKERLAHSEKLLSELSHEYSELQRKREMVEQRSDISIENINKTISELQVERESLLPVLSEINNVSIDKVHTVLSACRDIREKLSECLYELPDNTNEQFSKSKVDDTNKLRLNLLGEIDVLVKRVNKGEHLLEHLKNGERVTCPKCQNTFLPGMENMDYDKVKEQFNTLVESLDNAKKKLGEYDEYLVHASEYFAKYKEYMYILSSTNALEPLRLHLSEFHVTKYSPNSILTEFNNYVEKLKRLARISDIDNALIGLHDTVKQIHEADKIEINTEYMAKIYGMLRNEQDEINDINRMIEFIKKRDVLKAKTNEFKDFTEGAWNEINDMVLTLERQACRDFLSEELANVNKEMGKVDIELTQLKTTKSLLEDLHKRHIQAQEDVKLLGNLVDELNPVDGLIADHSMSFVKQFTDQLNHIINSIWTYDMRVLPCPANEDLTYKFPLYMGDSGIETPDINKASTAQKSVIDFAFKLLLITYLGLEDYPLYIDELTPNLDEIHRINIIGFVRDYVEQGRCSQMFMISHYVDGNNVFPHAEFVMISDSNIINKPKVYNERLSIEYY